MYQFLWFIDHVLQSELIQPGWKISCLLCWLDYPISFCTKLWVGCSISKQHLEGSWGRQLTSLQVIDLPSGHLLHGHWTFRIMDLPMKMIKNGDFPVRYVKRPEGTHGAPKRGQLGVLGPASGLCGFRLLHPCDVLGTMPLSIRRGNDCCSLRTGKWSLKKWVFPLKMVMFQKLC